MHRASAPQAFGSNQRTVAESQTSGKTRLLCARQGRMLPPTESHPDVVTHISQAASRDYSANVRHNLLSLFGSLSLDHRTHAVGYSLFCCCRLLNQVLRSLAPFIVTTTVMKANELPATSKLTVQNHNQRFIEYLHNFSRWKRTAHSQQLLV